jgi:hypothetical protein
VMAAVVTVVVLVVGAAVAAFVAVSSRAGGERPQARSTRECSRCGGLGRARMPAAVHKTRCPMCGGRGRHPMQGLFRGPLGGSIREEDYQDVWQAARSTVSPDADTSPLARCPYDLRHACVSTWLAGGVDSAQVAAWAGHSVAVRHRVYTHVVQGRRDVARRRVENVLCGADQDGAACEQGEAGDAGEGFADERKEE